jgi:hypothetical protein
MGNWFSKHAQQSRFLKDMPLDKDMTSEGGPHSEGPKAHGGDHPEAEFDYTPSMPGVIGTKITKDTTQLRNNSVKGFKTGDNYAPDDSIRNKQGDVATLNVSDDRTKAGASISAKPKKSNEVEIKIPKGSTKFT